jgi:hypothetical protein
VWSAREYNLKKTIRLGIRRAHASVIQRDIESAERHNMRRFNEAKARGEVFNLLKALSS